MHLLPETSLRLYGTTEPLASPQHLVAGPLSCWLENGALRNLRWNHIELVRGVSYLLRDTDWGTAPVTVQHLQIEQRPDHFQARFDLLMALPQGVLTAHVQIDGHAQGSLLFRVDASSPDALRTNRCGLVLLHPAGVAGTQLDVEHTSGSRDAVQFPTHISSGQPVLDIRRLRHTPLPGLVVDCLLQAELPHDPAGKFEMEDQRNWSDASFKTYVGSLHAPWPYTLPAELCLQQSLTLQICDTRPPTSSAVTRVAPGLPVQWGLATGARMPTVGLGVPMHRQPCLSQELQAVARLRPAWLVAEVMADGQDVEQHLCHITELAAACGAQIQLDVVCPAESTPVDAAQQLAHRCGRMGFIPHAVRPCPEPYLKSYQPQGHWPTLPSLESYAHAFAKAFPRSRIGGGMLTYFTELNRKRPTAEGLDFIGHTTCPIVHAADDRSVMETLETLPYILRSVKALWPTLGYRLGPATLAMHRNPYGDQPADNPLHQRKAMAADDPRHQGAYGAAWLAGYAAAVAHDGLELLSLNHSQGSSGPLLDRAQPGWQPGICVPAWGVQQVLVEAAGRPLHRLFHLPASLGGLAWMSASGKPTLLLANLTAEPQALQLPGRWQAHDLSIPRQPGSIETPPTPLPEALTLTAFQVLHLQAN